MSHTVVIFFFFAYGIYITLKLLLLCKQKNVSLLPCLGWCIDAILLVWWECGVHCSAKYIEEPESGSSFFLCFFSFRVVFVVSIVVHNTEFVLNTAVFSLLLKHMVTYSFVTHCSLVSI